MADDTISRQMAIDVLGKIFPADPMRNDYTKGITCGAALAKTYVEQLPTAERKGHWIYCEDEYGIDGYRCDECGFFVPWDYKHKSINFIEDYNFCPNCGADMRGDNDDGRYDKQTSGD